MAGDPSSRVSFPRLDGLRALCFFSVFFTHGFYTEDKAIMAHPLRHFVKGFLFASGDLGVNVFFVLSGFLITYLLMRERQMRGTIHVPHFWIRRLLRIWPLYFACVAFGVLGFPLIKSALGQVPGGPVDIRYYIFFASNFDLLYHGLPDSSCLAVLWSIAVEEQFYLVWPVLLFLLPLRAYPYLFIGVILSALGFNLVVHDSDTTMLHTFSCMGDLAMGALAAWVLSQEDLARRIAQWPAWVVVSAHAGFIILYLARGPLIEKVDADPGMLRMLIALAAATVVLCQAGWKGRACMLPDLPWLNYLGRISYGLYCLHLIGILTAVQLMRMAHVDHNVWQIVFLQPLIAFAITLLIASVSYRYYEAPFLRLKQRFAKIRR